jgi:hypothetical protein
MLNAAIPVSVGVAVVRDQFAFADLIAVECARPTVVA